MNIRILYSIFIGVLFAVLVGVGIDSFYPGPKMPEFPEQLRPVIDEEASAGAQIAKMAESQEEKEYQKRWEAYEVANKTYNRNVSMIALGFAVAALVVSLWLLKDIELISDGLLFGGLLTLLYSIIRGLSADSSQYRFVVVAISFVIALVVGYLKFIKPGQPVKPQVKKSLVN